MKKLGLANNLVASDHNKHAFVYVDTIGIIQIICRIEFNFQALKAIGETDQISEQAKHALLKGDLEKAQALYSKYMTDLDEHLAPPYPDYYKIQQNIWKCIWMRYGNRVIRGKVPQAPSNDFDSVD